LDKAALIIDVRGPDEFSKGRLESAINIPLNDIESQCSKLENEQVLLYCASGGRGQMARQALFKKGLKNVFNLGGKRRTMSIFS
jgi:phage shock protein E